MFNYSAKNISALIVYEFMSKLQNSVWGRVVNKYVTMLSVPGRTVLWVVLKWGKMNCKSFYSLTIFVLVLKRCIVNSIFRRCQVHEFFIKNLLSVWSTPLVIRSVFNTNTWYCYSTWLSASFLGTVFAF